MDIAIGSIVIEIGDIDRVGIGRGQGRAHRIAGGETKGSIDMIVIGMIIDTAIETGEIDIEIVTTAIGTGIGTGTITAVPGRETMIAIATMKTATPVARRITDAPLLHLTGVLVKTDHTTDETTATAPP